ncbi:hypothetical protein K461DRAFT_102381 [Myriangium duriaei CBS 260.36]|uniref:Uncharacterized protein n=1 Tax=Myriangium duriaei CBS 260.36 TaxID=1168546 RepID=A0A9P4J7X1_9PEZI|nr:hypothetical protein K461DRAFT_102381 [Myriangium duriaei CBS 260.36]
MSEDDDPLHYLPPGWTEEQYQNATDEDFDNLPDEVLERNMKRMAAEVAHKNQRSLAEINAKRAARGAPSVDDARRMREQRARHPLAQLLERKGWSDFGFMLFRMDYNDDDRWDRFSEEYEKLLDSGIDNSEAGSDKEKINDKLFMKIVDDDIVNGTGVIGVASAFQMFKQEGEVEPGLDTKMCLMADAECVASVLEPQKGTPPFLKAVDVNLADASYVLALDDNYEGSFRVAINAIVMEFYPALELFGHPSELAPFADPVWQDTLGNS